MLLPKKHEGLLKFKSGENCGHLDQIRPVTHHFCDEVQFICGFFETIFQLFQNAAALLLTGHYKDEFLILSSLHQLHFSFKMIGRFFFGLFFKSLNGLLCAFIYVALVACVLKNVLST